MQVRIDFSYLKHELHALARALAHAAYPRQKRLPEPTRKEARGDRKKSGIFSHKPARAISPIKTVGFHFPHDADLNALTKGSISLTFVNGHLDQGRSGGIVALANRVVVRQLVAALQIFLLPGRGRAIGCRYAQVDKIADSALNFRVPKAENGVIHNCAYHVRNSSFIRI